MNKQNKNPNKQKTKMTKLLMSPDISYITFKSER